MKKTFILFSALLLSACKTADTPQKSQPFVWEGANLYFLVTDRFANGTTANDVNFNRTEKPAVMRGFEGGDLRGVIQKIDEGYFKKLGINAIWMTPLVEQIHGVTDEGTGKTYAFHGYWTKDWTALDPNFGTKADLKELVEKAHAQGIRIVLDGVINHTGPVTATDAVWPADWVRAKPKCTYNNFKNTTACTLVENLPDILTEGEQPAELPPQLVAKWKSEGRYEEEIKELDAFFAKTGYPRAPKYYIMKWLADYIRDFGIDAYRVDTVKHANEDVWKEFQKVCQEAYEEYRAKNPSKSFETSQFYTIGEVYGYGISQKQQYDFGDKKVNYYQNGFKSLINFDFKGDATKSYEEIFSNYSKLLNTDLKGFTVMNYASSHDDGWPFDRDRKKNYETATKLLLAPGISQIYYGDETARSLVVPGAEGDANLRSNMNWSAAESDMETQKLLEHWQKLGRFRHDHPAVGAGIHNRVTASPYWFTRTFADDKVLVGLDLPKGEKRINVANLFADGARLRDAYSGKTIRVQRGTATIDTDFTIVLFERH